MFVLEKGRRDLKSHNCFVSLHITKTKVFQVKRCRQPAGFKKDSQAEEIEAKKIEESFRLLKISRITPCIAGLMHKTSITFQVFGFVRLFINSQLMIVFSVHDPTLGRDEDGAEWKKE